MKPTIKKPTKNQVEEAQTWSVWEKEESTFPWQYDEKETCLILKGKAIVKYAEGMVEFGPGDYVIFPEGLECTWNIKEKIKKHYKFG
jgi:uncharacterized cupin superfamily protein